MSDLRQAAQQALKALKDYERHTGFGSTATDALRAALSAEHGEQPEQGSAEVKRLRYLIADIAQAMRTKAANNPYIKAETLDALADEMVTYAVRLAGQEPEPVALPCCGYADASAVKWNPFNGVVQCHNCGQTYAHQPRRDMEQEPVAWLRREELADLQTCNYRHLGADSPRIWAPHQPDAPDPEQDMVPVYTHPPSQRSENLKSREWRSLSEEEIAEEAGTSRMRSAYPRKEQRMTRDDIIRMAREAGFVNSDAANIYQCLEKFAFLVTATEREACAKLAASKASVGDASNYPTYIAAAIRERSANASARSSP